MRNFPFRTAGNLLLATFAALIGFHLLIVLQIVPYGIVWAGKLSDPATMVKYESFSIATLVVCLLLVAGKMGYIAANLSARWINGGLWLMFLMFCLNTIGNLFAAHPLEKYGFTALTFMIAVLTLRLVIEKVEK